MSTKLWKLDPWLSVLTEYFLKFSVEEFKSIDEIIIAFNGKFSLRQYIPAKPSKSGCKMWGCIGITCFRYDFKIYE